MLLKTGNTKTGTGVWTFSLPTIKTCPGRTPCCEAACYGTKGFFNMPNVCRAHNYAYNATHGPNFVNRIRAEIRAFNIKTVRIHVSGDFYNAKYTKRWYAIIEKSRHTVFYTYTRSWRKSHILPALLDLAALPNMHMWWSVDKDIVAKGEVPPLDMGKVAYMAVGEEQVPEKTDLVFRVNRKKVEKYRGGILVCPAEQGIATKSGVHITCSRCRVCYRNKAVPKQRCHSESFENSVAAV